MFQKVYLKSIQRRSSRLIKNLEKTDNLKFYWIYYKIIFLFNKNIKYKKISKKYNKKLEKTLLKTLDYQLIK